MKKTFLEYLTESKKQYKFTLKLANVDTSNDATLDSLERALMPYQLVSATKFKRTPIQENPLDFPNIHNAEVHITDIVTEYPASANLIKNKICNVLGISQANVAVYTENDPRHAETIRYLEKNSPEFRKFYKSVFDEPENVVDATDYYGDEYNEKMVAAIVDELSKEENKAAKSVTGEEPEMDSIATSYDHGKMDKYHSELGLFGRMSKKPDVK